MPVNSKVNTELNIIVRTVTGELASDDVSQAISESLLDPDFKENMHVIWDLTQADVNKISTEQLLYVVEYIRSKIDSRGANYKIAIVAEMDLSYGISKMFEGYGGDLPVSIHVYRNIDEAYQWIAGEIN